MKTNLPSLKTHSVVFLISFLFINSTVFATTFYLKNANVTTANNFASWSTDPTGGNAGTPAGATDFADAAHIWVILNTQNATFANGSTTTFAGTLQVDGTLQIANNPSNGVNTQLNVNGTILFSRTNTSQITLSPGGGNGNTGFALGSSGILKTANINGIYGTLCSIALIGAKSSVDLPITATYEFNGTANQSATGLPATVGNLIINNTGGSNTTNVVSLTQATTVSTTLTMSNGNLNIGNFNLTIINISIASPSASKMIIASGTGELRKRFTANSSFTFPVGDNTNTTEYSPITLTVTGTSYSGTAYLGVRVTNAKHPNNASTTHFLNRYWSVTQSGVTTCAASTSADYPSADISGTETSIASARFQGTFSRTTNPWEKYGALGSNTLTATIETITSGQTTIFTGITNANPTVTILGGNVTVCQNATTTLTASPSGDTPFSYVWTGLISGSNTIAAVTANTASPGGPNSYTVTALDGNGISVTSPASTVTVTANSTPTVSLTSDDADNVFCAGTSVTFTATAANVSGGTVTYDFKVAGNSIQTSASNTYQTTNLTNGQVVTVDISISGGNCLTSNLASSNSISNVVNTNFTWYQDLDNDGYGNPSVSTINCIQPVGYVSSNTDCADSPILVGNPTGVLPQNVRPNSTEICYNNIDDDCDGFLSEGCPGVVVNMNPVYNNTVLPTLTSVVSALPYFYGGYTDIQYRFWIQNLTTLAIREFTSPSRFITLPSDIALYATNYDIKVCAVINQEIVPYSGNTIRVSTPANIATTHLTTAACGMTLAALNSVISAYGGTGAVSSYTFRIRLATDHPEAPELATYYFVTTTNGNRFIGANSFVNLSLQYNTTYSVSVLYNSTINGVNYTSSYGTECTITTPDIPVIGLSTPICGSTLSTMTSSISALPAYYALKYRFRRRLKVDETIPAPVTPVYSYSGELNSRFSTISTITQDGYALAYNTTYMVAVEYKILNNGIEVWSGYGSECEIRTPEASFTELMASQCGTPIMNGEDVIGFTPYPVTSATQKIYAVAVPGYTYRFQLQHFNGIDEDPDYEQTVNNSQNWFTLSMFTGLTANTEYKVTVILVSPYGEGQGKNDCILKTPNTTGKTVIVSPFAAKAYPNPFANNFLVDLTTESESAVSIKVYDMVGRLVDQQQIGVKSMESPAIGTQYPSGVYNVVITQGEEVQTIRVVKR